MNILIAVAILLSPLWTTISWDYQNTTFTYEVEGPGFLDVTDCGTAGDRFEVFVDGQSIGITSPPGNRLPIQIDFDECWSDPRFSKDVWLVPQGTHEIKVNVLLQTPNYDFPLYPAAIRFRPATPAPTLPPWALGSMALALIAAGAFTMRRLV